MNIYVYVQTEIALGFKKIKVLKGNRRKNKQIGLHQTKKLLHSKGNHQKNKRQPTEQENILGNDTSDKGLIPKIYK